MPEALSDHRVGREPLLDGEAAHAARETVEAIAASLRTFAERPVVSPAADNLTLASGLSGVALLHAWLAKIWPAPTHERAAWQLLDRVADGLGEVELRPFLFDGYAGVAFATEHAARLLGADGGDDTSDTIDEALLEWLHQPPDRSACDHDLALGLTGIGVWFLGRLPTARARAGLERVVDLLAAWAEHDSAGVTWARPPQLLPEAMRHDFPTGAYDVGLAHGVPGVIAMLAGACHHHVSETRARPLLEGAVAWVLAQRLPRGAGSAFPAFVGPRVEPRPSTPAWCYGDPGVAAALLVAARAAERDDWAREAIAIGLEAARASIGAQVMSAGLCHGTAGLAHMFHRMYLATGADDFRDAARVWIGRTLDLQQRGGALGGYGEDGGVLLGAAGIALALASACTAIEPVWDRFLLLSLPRAP